MAEQLVKRITKRTKKRALTTDAELVAALSYCDSPAAERYKRRREAVHPVTLRRLGSWRPLHVPRSVAKALRLDKRPVVGVVEVPMPAKQGV